MPILPALLIKDEKTFQRAIIVYLAVLTISFFCFLAYPVRVNRPSPDQAGFLRPVFAVLQSVDGPYNGLPSLQVSMAFVAAIAGLRASKRYVWLIGWAIAIAASALLIKQHVLVDVLGGMILAVTVDSVTFGCCIKRK